MMLDDTCSSPEERQHGSGLSRTLSHMNRRLILYWSTSQRFPTEIARSFETRQKIEPTSMTIGRSLRGICRKIETPLRRSTGEFRSEGRLSESDRDGSPPVTGYDSATLEPVSNGSALADIGMSVKEVRD